MLLRDKSSAVRDGVPSARLRVILELLDDLGTSLIGSTPCRPLQTWYVEPPYFHEEKLVSGK